MTVGVLENGDAQTFPSKFPTLKVHTLNKHAVMHSPSSAFQWDQNAWPWM